MNDHGAGARSSVDAMSASGSPPVGKAATSRARSERQCEPSHPAQADAVLYVNRDRRPPESQTVKRRRTFRRPAQTQALGVVVVSPAAVDPCGHRHLIQISDSSVIVQPMILRRLSRSAMPFLIGPLRVHFYASARLSQGFDWRAWHGPSSGAWLASGRDCDASRTQWPRTVRPRTSVAMLTRLTGREPDGAASRFPARVSIWWAMLGLNQRPLPCEGSALPLS